MTQATSDRTTVTPLLVDDNGAAELLHMSVGMVRKLTRSGQLPSVKVGRLRRYRVADLERVALEGVA